MKWNIGFKRSRERINGFMIEAGLRGMIKNGKPLLMVGIAFDVTEKKERYKELERKNVLLSELSSIDGLTKLKTIGL